MKRDSVFDFSRSCSCGRIQHGTLRRGHVWLEWWHGLQHQNRQRPSCVWSEKMWFLLWPVGYGCWVWQTHRDLIRGRTSRDQQLLYWSSVGETELRVSEMVGELKVSLNRWWILAWDLIVCDFLFISNRFFNIHASHSPPLDVWNLGIFGGHRFLLYQWCGPPKT